MKFFDLHCDTVLECVKNNKNFYNNGLHIDLDKITNIEKYVQFTAFFMENNWIKPKVVDYFDQGTNLLKNTKNSKVKFISSAENLAFLDNLDDISILEKYDIKMASLTWNGNNRLGSGTYATNSGITDFGKSVLNKLIDKNITIDVAHASENLFWDIAQNMQSPIVASHSNAFSVCQNERNLKDEQIREIIKRKGLIGLNFHRNFLNKNPENASVYDILKHAEYILALGGENTLAIGSDFDGADMPKGITGIESIPQLYRMFVENGFEQILADKIFYDNANNFFKKQNTV